MIAASVAGITSVNDVRVKANMTSDAIVAAASTIWRSTAVGRPPPDRTTVSVLAAAILVLSTELTETMVSPGTSSSLKELTATRAISSTT